jgi:hypothetical protein
MVFWCGIAAILLAVVMFNGSHSLYVHSKAVDGQYDRLVSLLDMCAIIAVVGCESVGRCSPVAVRAQGQTRRSQ